MSTIPSLLSVDDFASKIKAQYPDYASMDNADLVNKIVAKYPQYGSQVDMATSPAGADDPQGNYDFGQLGKVTGMRTNGRPATRQEAFSQLAQQRGFARTMGETFQSKQQDVSNFIQSSTDTDQATKGYLVDLAGMLLAGGNPEAGQAARWGAGASSGATSALRANAPALVKKFALGNTVGRLPAASLLGESFERPTAKDLVNLFRQGSDTAPNLAAQTDPTYFQQFGRQQHLPVAGPPPGPSTGAPPILTPLDAAQQREAGTSLSPPQPLPFLKPSQPPQQVAEQPIATAQHPPTPESAPVSSPVDPKQFYGKSSGKSNLKGNQRQLASPTASTAPNPGAVSQPAPHPQEIMDILNKPGMSDADLATVQSYFAKQRLTNMLLGNAMQKAAGQ